VSFGNSFGTAGKLVKLSTSVKAGMRALLAKHNIRLSAIQRHRPDPGRDVRRRDR
jgi:hypothetical protein